MLKNMQPTVKKSGLGKSRSQDRELAVLSKIIRADPKFTVEDVTPEGDVIFNVSIQQLGISRACLKRVPLVKTAFFGNFLGELIVRKNLRTFSALLAQIENTVYHNTVNNYRHRDFGMAIDYDNNAIQFTFHISLIQSILIEDFGKILQ